MLLSLLFLSLRCHPAEDGAVTVTAPSMPCAIAEHDFAGFECLSFDWRGWMSMTPDLSRCRPAQGLIAPPSLMACVAEMDATLHHPSR